MMAEKEVKKPTFLVNKDGFPLNPYTVDALWTFVKETYPDGGRYETDIRGNGSIARAVMPTLPQTNAAKTASDNLDGIQRYLNQLQYNHTGMQFFEIKKYRPISGLMDVAREMIKESLPIKCLEAVILSIYLSPGIPGLDRFTISFKSKFGKNIHRHVVLGLCHGSHYGALGLSRREELMYKPLEFKSLAGLILDYKQSYEKCNHVLKKVKFSSPIVQDLRSCKQINWKYFTLPICKMDDDKIKITLDRYSRDLKTL